MTIIKESILTHVITTSLRALMVLAVATLTGCAAGLDGDYACDKVGGINGCTDMTEIRSLVDSGAFTQPKNLSASSQALTPTDFIPLPRRDRNGSPLRTSESVQKITIFPFINKHGDYVDTTDVYIVLDKSRWTGRPAHLIKGD